MEGGQPIFDLFVRNAATVRFALLVNLGRRKIPIELAAFDMDMERLSRIVEER